MNRCKGTERNDILRFVSRKVIRVTEFPIKNSESLHSMPLYQQTANCLFQR